uniref:hypothetical protein n=1 Tax=Drechslerella dactyloides TaxID=74499 RepID=UPI0022FD8191|nr:hypothetical protein PNX16_mgp084 [Drechslerella dactyloides]WAN89767.1 hypothetical protein [Drechslerella dactyloides]
MIINYKNLNKLHPLYVTGFSVTSVVFCISSLNIFINKRFRIENLLHFSSSSLNKDNIKPVAIYPNSDTQKLEILKNNKNKAGIYRWVNLINGKTYIGSSNNLGVRLRNYYKISFLEIETKKNKSMIYNAVLKHGYSKFSLEILEYCDSKDLIKREQYFIDLLKPEYNILKKAFSSLGFKHSEETQKRMSDSQKRINRLGRNNPMFGKVRAEGAGNPSQRISVFNAVNNETHEYDSIKAAGLALGIIPSVITRYVKNNQKKPYKGKYIFQKI